MATTAHGRSVALQSDADLVEINVDKARAVHAWLKGQGIELPSEDESALCADLSDLYAGALRYQGLLDQLLDGVISDRAEMAQQVTDIAVELQHLGGHIRSVSKRLRAVANRLDNDD